MKRARVLLLALSILAVILASCAPAATATLTQPPAAMVTEPPPVVEATAPAGGEVMTVNPAKQEGTVYYLAMIGNNVWEVYAAHLFKNIGEALGFEVNLVNAENSADNQVNQLISIIPLQPAAIFLKSVDTTLIADAVGQAGAAGIPVITFDGTVTSGNPALTVDVGLVNYGRMAAEEVLAFLKEKYGAEKGKVLNLQGDISVPYSPLMTQGFHEVMDQYPNITIIDKDTVGWEITAAANVAADQLTVNPDIDAMFVHTDSRFPGVVSVLQERGFDKGEVYLIGVDGDPTAMNLIREGWVNATITPPMEQYVYGCYAFIDKIIAGEALQPGLYDLNGVTAELKIEKWGPALYLPGILITTENVEDPALWGNADLD